MDFAYARQLIIISRSEVLSGYMHLELWACMMLLYQLDEKILVRRLLQYPWEIVFDYALRHIFQSVNSDHESLRNTLTI